MREKNTFVLMNKNIKSVFLYLGFLGIIFLFLGKAGFFDLLNRLHPFVWGALVAITLIGGAILHSKNPTIEKYKKISSLSLRWVIISFVLLTFAVAQLFPVYIIWRAPQMFAVHEELGWRENNFKTIHLVAFAYLILLFNIGFLVWHFLIKKYKTSPLRNNLYYFGIWLGDLALLALLMFMIFQPPWWAGGCGKCGT